MFQRILLAWDGSEVALRAFDAAIDLTRRYDAELVAVSVAYSPAHAETAADRAETAQAAHRYLTGSFEEVADRAHRAGVQVSHQIIEGDDPAQALLAHCHTHGFDLIVAGHHRAGRAGRLLLKGVVPALIENGAPVLVVGDYEYGGSRGA
ncbi:universal stress protein [Conexibacter sp. S30A1]|uniref:universal stress protein n=1 Tax=Conexibacter sp. S30A1 TaxID=2937800 RepID=UPI00200BECD0|nr:universal stress protein [Conexibacter sp. S30A1]